MKKYFVLIFAALSISLSATSCNRNSSGDDNAATSGEVVNATDTKGETVAAKGGDEIAAAVSDGNAATPMASEAPAEPVSPAFRETENFDSKMRQYGLVDLQAVDSRFVVDLKYATSDNFAGRNMYGSLNKAYALESTARMLVKALDFIQQQDPSLTIVIYDAARPQSVQRIMWDVVKGTKNAAYVANPAKGGPHNYGIAVDIGLCKTNGTPIDMGTPFDTFDETAHITAEQMLVKKGKITAEAAKNRQLLRDAMTRAGFRTFSREWWHFITCRPAQARAKGIKLLDF